MELYTSIFSEKLSDKNVEEFFKSNKKVYKIDDCYLVQELEKIDTGKPVEELKKTFRGKLPEYINNRASEIVSDVPVLSYEIYLKELKDSLIFNGEVIKGNLQRLWLRGNDGYEAGSVLILNKYQGKYTIISEVYKGGKLVKVFESDLEEILKQMETK